MQEAGQPDPPNPRRVSLPLATRPRTSLGTLFADVEVAALRAWLGGSQGPALATAPGGSGLTTLVRLLLAEAGMDTVWIGCGTPRVKALLAAAGSSPVSVVMRRKAIVVDEVEAMGSAGETGALAEAVAFARSSPPLPVLFLGKACRSKKPTEFARAWPKFPFARPSTLKMEAYLRGVAAKHRICIPGCDVAALAKEAKGDVRAALMAMDLIAAGSGTGDDPQLQQGQRQRQHQHPRRQLLKDEADDGLDLVEAVLCGERAGSVEDALLVFRKDPGMVAMGLYENYLVGGGVDAAGAARLADLFASADVLDKYMYSRQAWDLHDVYGAVAVGGTGAVVRGCLETTETTSVPYSTRKAPRKRASVTTFGSVWSKSYNMFAKMKHVRAASLKCAEAGVAALGPCDLALVRLSLKHAVESGQESLIKDIVGPLGAPEVLGLARLSVGGSSWYKAAHQTRIKRLLS